MLLGALSLILACLLALLFFKDYKTRSRMKLAERIPGPKALPLLGNVLELLFYTNSKLHMFCVFLSVTNTIVEHYDILIWE
jgi:hypothetical protein